MPSLPAISHPESERRLTLVPPRQKPHTALALWHLLSLDAPTVATIWTAFIAHASHIQLPATSLAAMFLAVWMIYAADRLLDARTSHAINLEERHHFHFHHKKFFLTGIVIASLTLAVLLPRLDPAAIHLYTVLASLLFAYFFILHIYPTKARLPKEFAVGLFFSAAVFIPAIARRPDLRLILLPAAILFAALCTLNCLYLYAWEHPTHRTSAHWTTRFATNHLPALTITVLCISALLVVIPERNLRLYPCFFLSATLLLILHAQRHRLTRTHLRAAADLALLTPLLFLLA